MRFRAGSSRCPSRPQVFLTLLGLPLEELPRSSKMKDGIIRPHHVVGRRAGASRTRSPTRRDGDVHLRLLQPRSSTSVRREPRDDLLTRFLEAEVEGDRLTRDDILDICFLFLIAGLDTVSRVARLLLPATSPSIPSSGASSSPTRVVPAAVEELLRWETPVDRGPAHRDPGRRGPRWLPDQARASTSPRLLGSANTDEAESPTPTTCAWDRDVNRHLAFGGGVHRCLGSHLARRGAAGRAARVARPHSRATRIKPGVDLGTRPGSVRSTTSRWSSASRCDRWVRVG